MPVLSLRVHNALTGKGACKSSRGSGGVILLRAASDRFYADADRRKWLRIAIAVVPMWYRQATPSPTNTR